MLKLMQESYDTLNDHLESSNVSKVKRKKAKSQSYLNTLLDKENQKKDYWIKSIQKKANNMDEKDMLLKS